MTYPFPYKSIETQIEEHLLKQVNKLLIDYTQPPANQLPDADKRYLESMFAEVFPDAAQNYPLSETERADLQYYRLIEVVRYEAVPILNLLEHVEAVSEITDYVVPILYVVPAMGLAPVDYPNLQQNTLAYLYPVNLRLILNREEQAYEDLTATATESLIREGLKYILDRASFANIIAPRSGYTIPSRVVDMVRFERSTLEGFLSPWFAFDYEFSFIIQEQATLSANTTN